MKRKDTLRPWLNAIAVLATIVVNALANSLPINGLNTGEISDQFEIYFVPAGYVFSIWGLIYLALAAFALYQALPAQRDNPRLRNVGYWFVGSSLANIAWIFLWHYQIFPLTLVAMGFLLISLIICYLRLETGKTKVNPWEKWLVRAPFSLYLGWITVATIANVTQLLDYVNWGGWGISPEWWFVIIIAVATAIASLVSWTRGDVVYMLVILWAFVGIALKHADTPMVAVTTWVLTGVTAVMTVVGAVQNRETYP
jgi:hypothetical protein